MDGLRNEIFPRDAEACRDLASYFEAQADTLRLHAYRLDQAELSDWRRTFKVWRAGKIARALSENGMPDGMAVKTTARRLDIEPETVAAQLRFQMKAALRRAQDRQRKEARRLAKAGRSIRQIADALGLSKSRVQQILKNRTAKVDRKVKSIQFL